MFPRGTAAHVQKPEQGAFPHFKDADLLIILNGSRQYTLHSSLLRSISSRIEGLCSKQGEAKLTSKAIRRGTVVKFRMIMVPNEELITIPLDSEGKPVIHYSIGLDLENGVVVPQIIHSYHAVLGAFYNIPIDLGNYGPDYMSDILTSALGILEVAEYLDCVHIVTKPFEATLLAAGQVFQQSIGSGPIAWLDFAYRIRSRSIFREALIHAAGRYNNKGNGPGIAALPEPVAEILHKKGKAVKAAMQDAEMKILSYYPSHLQREKTVGRADKDSIGRASYANDVMSWIALTALRHFFSQNVTLNNSHDGEDMGYELMTAVQKGGDAYLSRVQMEGFHNIFPMSRKGVAVVEYKLNEMKEVIKAFTRDLARNESQLDCRSHPTDHFTCTIVNAEDYPWKTDDPWGTGPTDTDDDSSDE